MDNKKKVARRVLVCIGGQDKTLILRGWNSFFFLFLGEKSGATNTEEKNTKGKENIEREEKPEKGIQDSNQEELEKRETKVWPHLTSPIT